MKRRPEQPASKRRPKRLREPSPTPLFERVTERTHKLAVGAGWIRPSRAIPDGPVGYVELENGGSVGYFPRFLSDSAAIFSELASTVNWERRQICLYGKNVWQPRLVAYMARDLTLSYTYSRTTLVPTEYSPTVAAIQSRVEQELGTTFNCVLLNYYRDGHDHMGWHSDNEPLFGPEPVIASISVGSERAFDLKSAQNPQIRWRCLLGNGDLFVMRGGAVQREWKHALLPNKNIQSSRINLTFRRITHPEQPHKTTK